MPKVVVADLFKSVSAFCSSAIRESRTTDPGVCTGNQETKGKNEDVLGKRNAVESFQEVTRNVKKLKSGSRSCPVLQEGSHLVGRLQLCNKKQHSWSGPSAAADCLAFTDSSASVCCSISQGVDVSFAGKLVRVNSWTFVPFRESGSLGDSRSGHGSTKSKNEALESKDEARKGSSISYARKNGIGEVTDIGKGFDGAGNSGFLEIHSMELLEEESAEVPTFPSICVDPAAADIRDTLFESPLIKQKEHGSRLTIFGKLQCVSPQFSLPYNITTNDRENSSVLDRPTSNHLSMIGFLAELEYCPACSFHYNDIWNMDKKKESRRTRRLFVDDHSRKNAVETDSEELKTVDYLYIYFSGSMAAWRPFLSGNIKRCISVSGLRKKLVITGTAKNRQFLLVATRTTLILPFLDPHHVGAGQSHISVDTGRHRADENNADHCECMRNSECVSESSCHYPRIVSYAGFVTEVLFQGILVELDKRVWLLLSEQGQSRVYGLRIGAMLGVREVHAVTISTPLEKALLLGACLRSHVSVLRFSPQHSPPLRPLHTSSMLLRYLQKVSFSSAFWILSLIGSFRQKFRGIYSDKEIVGSKKNPGIILKFVQKVLSPDETLERPDYLKEFFEHHHRSCSGGTAGHVALSTVLPFSSLTEATIKCSKLRTKPTRTDYCTDYPRWLRGRRLLSSLDNSATSWKFPCSVLCSEELGVTLLGCLQVGQESGQLELMDATGSICVVVPDLSSSTQVSGTYMVSKFTLVMKELPEDIYSIEDAKCDERMDHCASWSSLLKDKKALIGSFQAPELLVHFYLRDAELVDVVGFRSGSEASPLQRSKRSCLDPEQSKETGSMMGLDLENIIAWLRERDLEMLGGTVPADGLKYLRDISRLELPTESLRVSCKVMAVDLLVFIYEGGVSGIRTSSSKTFSRPYPEQGGWFSPSNLSTLIRVVVDDGYGLAHCWALGHAAVSILRLRESVLESELPPDLVGRVSEKYGNSQIQLTLVECISCLVRTRRKLILRSEKPYGASSDTSPTLLWCGQETPDSDEQAFMQGLVSRACNNQALVLTLGKVLPQGEDAPKSSCPLECSRRLAQWSGYQRSAEDIGLQHLFAAKVESGVQLSDIKAACDEVESLL
ncbi:hypothetical protein R1sor_005760 [Riccia sorocarpa]|uniref:CST complex subunit CTC1 n=1 Tax=Riccia sorocarpa TaxID=122646 RepID=A0ABD3HNX3_9MARC